MNLIIRILIRTLLIALLIGVHLSLTYALPFPFSKLNIIMAGLAVMLLRTHSGAVIWIGIIIHMILELYATTPFGIILISAALALLITLWFMRSMLGTPHAFVAMLGAAVLVFLFRLIYTALVAILTAAGSASISILPLLPIFMWELLTTAGAAGLIYLLLPALRLWKFEATKKQSIYAGN